MSIDNQTKFRCNYPAQNPFPKEKSKKITDKDPGNHIVSQRQFVGSDGALPLYLLDFCLFNHDPVFGQKFLLTQHFIESFVLISPLSIFDLLFLKYYRFDFAQAVAVILFLVWFWRIQEILVQVFIKGLKFASGGSSGVLYRF